MTRAMIRAAAADLEYAGNYVGSAVARLQADADPDWAPTIKVLAAYADRLKEAAAELDPAGGEW